MITVAKNGKPVGLGLLGDILAGCMRGHFRNLGLIRDPSVGRVSDDFVLPLGKATSNIVSSRYPSSNNAPEIISPYSCHSLHRWAVIIGADSNGDDRSRRVHHHFVSGQL